MWSAAASSVGGRGRALCVLVEKVESGRGDGGLELMVLLRVMVAVEVATGLRLGSLSE